MADEPDTEETDADAAPSNAELAARVDSLDGKLDTILSKLGGAKDDAHAAAQQHTEDRLDRPSNIAEEIQRQFAEKEKAAAASAREQSDADWRKSVDDRLTGMTEHVPEAPVRRVEKMMGWR